MAKGPATVDGRLAIGLTEEQAADVKTQRINFYAPRRSVEDV
jgi:hypothetical protein